MLYVAEYLGDKIYFNSFDEVKKYYDHEEVETVDDLNEVLRAEAEGMVSPVVSEVSE